MSFKFDSVADKHGMHAQISSWADQVQRGWLVGKKIGEENPAPIPKALIWVGMGGSAIGGDFCAALAEDHAKFPIHVHRGGKLPAWVDKDCHVLLVSFSGNTAETLETAEEAVERGCSIDALTSGGKLEKFVEEKGVTPWRIPGDRPPRTALGDIFSFAYGAMCGRGWVFTDNEDVREAVMILQQAGEILKNPPTEENPLYSMLEMFKDRYAMIYGTGRMLPVARRWACQINENAKRPAHWGELPEMNHNEVVAYKEDSPWGEKGAVMILLDPNSPDDIKLRSEVTVELAEQCGWTVGILEPSSKSHFARILELSLIGDWLSHWMALSDRIDPTPIPTIDKLKSVLDAKSK